MAAALTCFPMTLRTSYHSVKLNFYRPCSFSFSLAVFQNRKLWLLSQNSIQYHENPFLLQTKFSSQKLLCNTHNKHLPPCEHGKRLINSACRAKILSFKDLRGNNSHAARGRGTGLQRSNSSFVVIGRTFTSTEDVNVPSVPELATRIVRATEEVDVMAGSLQSSAVENLIDDLLTEGLTPHYVERLLSGKLWFLQQPEATVDVCRLLLQHGLSSKLTCNAMRHIPFSLHQDIDIVPSRITDALLILRGFGLSEKETISLLKKNPSVLFSDKQSLLTALARIKTLFLADESKQVVRMSPSILSHDWMSIAKKYDYAIGTMGYLQADLLKSRIFSYPFHHIEDRHVFLLRAKVFKPVNPKLDSALNPNPSLKMVVDSPDHTFIKLVEGVTLEDYAIFRKMRMVEREAESSREEEEGEEEEYESGDEDLNVHRQERKNPNNQKIYK